MRFVHASSAAAAESPAHTSHQCRTRRSDRTGTRRTRTTALITVFSLIVGFAVNSTSVASADPAPATPDAPTSLVAYRGNTSAEIAFTAGADGGAVITNYKYSTDDGSSWTAFSPTVTSSPVTIGGLTNGTNYNIKLRAVNSVGDGAVSDAVSVTPAVTGAVTWTARTAAEANAWYSVTYGNGVFVAVAATPPPFGPPSGANRVMTSTDGVTWTARTAAEANSWSSVTYGNGVFVAVASDGSSRVMTSADGVTWTARTAAEGNPWRSVTYGNGVFVAVASTGTNAAMTSTNGVTWSARSAAEGNPWYSVTYGNGVFVAVAASGTNRVMTSSLAEPTAPSAPTSLVTTAGVGSASIAFTAGADGGSAITKYQYRVGSGSWTDAVGTTSPITITGLTNWATVNIKLRAVNYAGAGEASSAVRVWPRIAGPSLTSVKAHGITGLRAAFGAWTPVGGTVSHYWVYAYAKGTNTVVSSCRSTAASRGCLIKGLTWYTEYDVAVRGFFTLTGSNDVRPTVDSARLTVQTSI